MNSNVVRTALSKCTINVRVVFRSSLVTGASRGIGYYLSSLFARDQYRLILVSRTRSDLERVKEEFHQRYHCPRIDVYAKDLSQPNSAMELVEEMNTNIDVLVNNAGSGVRGHIWKTKIDDDVATIRLNILSTMQLTKLILPTMIERNYGRILMLGSSASFQPNPLLANYAATKAFIASYTDALIDELKETKVTATLLVPGPTDTVRFTSVSELHSLFLPQGILQSSRCKQRLPRINEDVG